MFTDAQFVRITGRAEMGFQSSRRIEAASIEHDGRSLVEPVVDEEIHGMLLPSDFPGNDNSSGVTMGVGFVVMAVNVAAAALFF